MGKKKEIANAKEGKVWGPWWNPFTLKLKRGYSCGKVAANTSAPAAVAVASAAAKRKIKQIKSRTQSTSYITHVCPVWPMYVGSVYVCSLCSPIPKSLCIYVEKKPQLRVTYNPHTTESRKNAIEKCSLCWPFSDFYQAPQLLVLFVLSEFRTKSALKSRWRETFLFFFFLKRPKGCQKHLN